MLKCCLRFAAPLLVLLVTSEVNAESHNLDAKSLGGDISISTSDLMSQAPPAEGDSLKWEYVNSASEVGIDWTIVSESEYARILERSRKQKGSLDSSSILELAKEIFPKSSDYTKPIRLSASVPSGYLLDNGNEAKFSAEQFSSFSNNGNGTGNQNYVGILDYMFSEDLLVSLFYSEADDPLISYIPSRGGQPANFWQSYGFSGTFLLYEAREWIASFRGSIERWNVGSGGCDSFSCKEDTSASGNIFNNSGNRVFTSNLVGSTALALSYSGFDNFQLSFSPGISFLPATQGVNQGGSGKFYGTNFYISGGATWNISHKLDVSGSALLPIGPGQNSFDRNLDFYKVPIFTTQLSYSLNPRISLSASLTNGFGGTPATGILSLPSSNRALYNAKFSWIPQAKDTPALPFKRRSQSLTMGGLSVANALVPQAGKFTSSINFDDHGNRFGQIKWSASNDFEFLLFNAGSFQNVRPINALVNGYANDGGFNQRFGGKAVFMHQLRGAPFTTSGSISLGRNYDTSSFQGYLFTEAICTWEANESLAINFNPKLAWSGISSPFGVGISTNIGLSSYLQLIPEVNASLYSIKTSNATLALRWLASSSSALDIYVSNAAGFYDIGQLLKSDSYRVGFKFTVQL